jgi:3-deoxy-D-manno-octulosonic-acid transferase
MNIWAIIYNLLAIPIIGILYRVLYLFNNKIKQREQNIDKHLDGLPTKNKNKLRILLHSSSMGEFEQAKPLIERLKRKSENIEIIASFYSPSGFENQKSYKYIDYNVYMPFDSLKNARKFVSKTNPDIVVFIRYDIWRNHIAMFKLNHIPLLLINATKPGSFWGSFFITKSFFKNIYSFFNEIYTLGEKHTEYFNSLNLESRIVNSADTRYDRIMEKVTKNLNSDILDRNVFQGKKVLVLGSSWEKEEKMVSEIYNRYKDKIFFIVVPHEPTREHLEMSKAFFGDSIFLSEYDKNIDYNISSIIVDNIGVLLGLYSYADAAFVGGGFGKNVHSLSEPAGYSLPLCCGPKFDRSPDAEGLLKLGSLQIINNLNDLIIFINDILNKDKAENMGYNSGKYIKEKIGSSNIITSKILELAEKKQIMFAEIHT